MLSQQRTGLTEDEKNEYNKINLKVPELAFKPDFFFALGSPIGRRRLVGWRGICVHGRLQR